MKVQSILNIIVAISGIILVLSLIEFKSPIAIPGNIEENFFVLAVAVDKSEINPEEYRLTIISEKFSGSNSKSSSNESKTAEIAYSDGRTILEAVRNFHIFHSKKLFWGHIKYIIISEEIARDNILNALDFFIRDHELRFNTSVLISKDTSAKSILELGEKNKEFIPDTLKSIFNNMSRLSYSKIVKLSEAMEKFDDKYKDQCIPYVRIMKEEDEKSDENKEKSSKGSNKQESDKKENINLAIDGFAVFKGEKLIDFVSRNSARGVNWINSDIDSSIIILKYPNNSYVSLEIINEKATVDVKYNDNIEVNIKVIFTTNFNEQMSQKDIYHEDTLKKIIESQSEIVKKEIEDTIEYAKKNNVDIFDISGKIYHKYPIKWDKIKDNWKEIFKDIKITVNIESNINRTYHIRQGIRSEGGGK